MIVEAVAGIGVMRRTPIIVKGKLSINANNVMIGGGRDEV